jgi:hypothetical protein
MVKKRVVKKAVRRKAASGKASTRRARTAVYPITIKDLTDLMNEMEAWCCALREILLSLPPNFVVATPKTSRGVILWDSGGQLPMIKGCPPPRLPNCAKKPIRRPAGRRAKKA